MRIASVEVEDDGVNSKRSRGSPRSDGSTHKDDPRAPGWAERLFQKYVVINFAAVVISSQELMQLWSYYEWTVKNAACFHNILCPLSRLVNLHVQCTF